MTPTTCPCGAPATYTARTRSQESRFSGKDDGRTSYGYWIDAACGAHVYLLEDGTHEPMVARS